MKYNVTFIKVWFQNRRAKFRRHEKQKRNSVSNLTNSNTNLVLHSHCSQFDKNLQPYPYYQTNIPVNSFEDSPMKPNSVGIVPMKKQLYSTTDSTSFGSSNSCSSSTNLLNSSLSSTSLLLEPSTGYRQSTSFSSSQDYNQ